MFHLLLAEAYVHTCKCKCNCKF